MENISKSLKKNLSEKNFTSSSKRIKLNQNIFTVDVRNDIEKDLNSDSKMVKSLEMVLYVLLNIKDNLKMIKNMEMEK